MRLRSTPLRAGGRKAGGRSPRSPSPAGRGGAHISRSPPSDEELLSPRSLSQETWAPRGRGEGGGGRKHAVEPVLPDAQFVEPDKTIDFLYKPHTLAALFATMAYVGYNAFYRSFSSYEERQRASLMVCASVFLVFCAVQLRDNLLVRPHPVLWRVVQGVSCLYLAFLVYVLMQPIAEARQIMKIWDESQGKMPEENYKLYATDCRIYTPEHPTNKFNIVWGHMDLFIFAHFFGWIAKALLWRDWTCCVILSVMWEVCEISFQHLLPNFKECWWDHWILDVLTANLGGAYVGIQLCRYFEAHEYNWTGKRKIPSAQARLRRLLVQFTPFSWTSYTWSALTSFRRLRQMITGFTIFLIGELNVFFLKYCLWVSPGSILNVQRLGIMFFVMFPAMREFYEYMSPAARRLGPNLWLGCCVVTVELLIVLKANNEDPMLYRAHETMGIDPPPPVPSTREVGYSWLTTVFLFNLWAFLHFGWPKIRGGRLLFASLLPLLYLIVRDAWSTFHW